MARLAPDAVLPRPRRPARRRRRWRDLLPRLLAGAAPPDATAVELVRGRSTASARACGSTYRRRRRARSVASARTFPAGRRPARQRGPRAGGARRRPGGRRAARPGAGRRLVGLPGRPPAARPRPLTARPAAAPRWRAAGPPASWSAYCPGAGRHAPCARRRPARRSATPRRTARRAASTRGCARPAVDARTRPCCADGVATSPRTARLRLRGPRCCRCSRCPASSGAGCRPAHGDGAGRGSARRSPPCTPPRRLPTLRPPRAAALDAAPGLVAQRPPGRWPARSRRLLATLARRPAAPARPVALLHGDCHPKNALLSTATRRADRPRPGRHRPGRRRPRQPARPAAARPAGRPARRRRRRRAAPSVPGRLRRRAAAAAGPTLRWHTAAALVAERARAGRQPGRPADAWRGSPDAARRPRARAAGGVAP